MHRHLVLIAVVALPLAGCGGGGGGAAPTVFAAASLAAAVREVDPAAAVSVGGSDQLAFQIRQGAPADLFVSASTRYTRGLYAAGLVEEPVEIARNRLVVITPPGANRVMRPADLAAPGVRLVIGAPAVPVGDYARRALRRMGLLAAVRRNIVSEAPDVRAIVTQVTLGEADAGVVYATDARAVGDAVRQVPLPAAAQPPIIATAAVLRSSDDPAAARELLRRLRGPEGRRVLARLGFTVPAP